MLHISKLGHKRDRTIKAQCVGCLRVFIVVFFYAYRIMELLKQNPDESYSQFSICHHMEMSIPSTQKNIAGMLNIKCKYNSSVGWMCQLCFT